MFFIECFRVTSLICVVFKGLKGDDSTVASVDQNESEKAAQIDLVTNLANMLVSLLSMYNSIVYDIRKRDNETNEDKLIVSRVTDLIR
jgi:hypothetical protein